MALRSPREYDDNMTQITVNLSEEVVAQLRAIAEPRGRTVEDEVCDVINARFRAMTFTEFERRVRKMHAEAAARGDVSHLPPPEVLERWIADGRQ